MLNSDDTEREEYLDYVRELLMYYLRKCKDIYIETPSPYTNVHSLIHLPDDVEHFRCSLNGISDLESADLKKMVRQSRNPIAQVAKRLAETRAVYKM